MLALTRKIGERIKIGNGKNEIIVEVVSVRGNYVKLAIDADRSIPIMREELLNEEKMQVSRL